MEAMEAIDKLKEIAAKAPALLTAISADEAAKHPVPGKLSKKQGTRSFGGFRLQQPPAYRACATGKGALASRLRWRPLGDAAQ
jgi:hypothetical protein